MGEVDDDGQPVAHFWRQEYEFWSSPLKACLQKCLKKIRTRLDFLCNPFCLDCRRIALNGRCLVKKRILTGTCLLNLRTLIGTCLLNLGVLIGTCLLKSVPLVFELALAEGQRVNIMKCRKYSKKLLNVSSTVHL